MRQTRLALSYNGLILLRASGGAGGLVVLAGFKPVAGRREAAWVGSIPTRLRQIKNPD
jgi:hypothetical protein